MQPNKAISLDFVKNGTCILAKNRFTEGTMLEKALL
jgi:hypothetical protein